MAGLLSGLSSLGLTGFDDAKVYDDPGEKEEKAEQKKEAAKAEINEEDYIFDKTYECPVCFKAFKEKTVRAGKIRLIGSDKDLKPIYEQMEPLKYDVVQCPRCGYATLARYFGGLTQAQIKLIRENISRGYKAAPVETKTYSYEDALSRYKLCLANAIVKHAKDSEKAYICLKAGWLLRGMQNELELSGSTDKEKREELKAQEKEFLQNALEGFINARQAEASPIAGMDQITLDYLIAALSMEAGKYETAAKLISSILGSKSANNRMKDKARDLKTELSQLIKEKNASKNG